MKGMKYYVKMSDFVFVTQKIQGHTSTHAHRTLTHFANP